MRAEGRMIASIADALGRGRGFVVRAIAEAGVSLGAFLVGARRRLGR
jgi:hypothetical protein